MTPVRVLFAGSPEIAVPSLETVAAAADVVGVLTNPPAPKGRGLRPEPTPVALKAAEILPGVPVLEPGRLGPAEREAVAALGPDLLVVFAYGRLFGPKFLSLFPRGGINAHPSLLPRWRGCAPIPYAILSRDQVTGVSVQRLALRMDSGDVLLRETVELDARETTESLSAKAAAAGARLLARAVENAMAGRETPEAQDESQATYSSAISKDDGRVDWSLDALDIDARARAYYPWPGAWTTWNGERLALLDLEPSGGSSDAEPGTVLSVDTPKGIMVQTGQGLVALKRLQLRGKKPLGYKDFLNGARGFVGSVLGLP